ncbi:acyl-CoA reductase [Haliangium ochraceum]|uniref:Acyl-CoA reductase n=1 Tax=Haliangium ochraceum (strain DSM 14365 / JCM 11303 / SMP-2) TaxID=502025 RepID=D0LNR7_HALO1|nr:acyl-CoA reductase [Haliangium ochraceum]ACY16972.1 acyl-CoA reductase [Haliangium ochraceum DSM 14365]
MSRHHQDEVSRVPEALRDLEIEHRALSHPRDAHARPWHCARPSLSAWPEAVERLRAAARALRAMSTEELVAAIHRVAIRWCNPSWPVRREARDRVVAATGFSPTVVDHSFDLELRNYRSASLWATLKRELGDPRALDRFRPDSELRGASLALGPRATLVVLTGNVPGLPALSLVRSLLLRSAVIAKVASGEPTFASAFVRSLADEDPRLGDAILVTYWSREEDRILRAVLDQVDAVIAYGGDAACAAVRRNLAPHHRYLEHGHKLSLGYLSRAYLRSHELHRVADQIACDVCAFNQQACITPQAYFVQGTMSEVRAFAERVEAAMQAYARYCPLGALSAEEQSSLQYTRLAHTWHRAEDGGRVRGANDLQWTVEVAPALDLRGSQPRFLRLVAVPDEDSFLRAIAEHGRHLQNIALGTEPEQLAALAHAVARLGASRVCEPGRMAEPSLMWRHDGHMCLGQLVRWCDIEMHSDAPLASGRRETH